MHFHSSQTMKAYIVGAVVSILVAAVTGDGCDTIDGSWVNQLGSEMDLTHDSGGTLTGKYITKVESKEGAAGKEMTSDIIGQCHMCDGEPTIMTSWLLRSKLDKCGDRWKAVRIGQDYFTRKTAPSENQQRARMLKTIITSDGFLEAFDYHKRYRRDTGASEAADTVSCEIAPAKWYNAIGSMLDVTNLGKGILKGDYWTAKEVQAQKLDGKHSRVHGQHNEAKEQHTMAFFVSWNNGESVTGWVGQCHVCNKTNSTEKEAILETTWFHRVAVTSCHANWKSTLYGQTSFRRDVQRPVAPGDDVVGEFGEEVALCPPSASSATATYRPLSALIGLALIYVLLA